LQQVSDVLRRTSRFVVLARRLQSQMAEIGNYATETHRATKNSDIKNNSASLDGGIRSSMPGLESEGEKDRALAQAALSIAELSTLLHD